MSDVTAMKIRLGLPVSKPRPDDYPADKFWDDIELRLLIVFSHCDKRREVH